MKQNRHHLRQFFCLTFILIFSSVLAISVHAGVMILSNETIAGTPSVANERQGFDLPFDGSNGSGQIFYQCLDSSRVIGCTQADCQLYRVGTGQQLGCTENACAVYRQLPGRQLICTKLNCQYVLENGTAAYSTIWGTDGQQILRFTKLLNGQYYCHTGGCSVYQKIGGNRVACHEKGCQYFGVQNKIIGCSKRECQYYTPQINQEFRCSGEACYFKAFAKNYQMACDAYRCHSVYTGSNCRLPVIEGWRFF